MLRLFYLYPCYLTFLCLTSYYTTSLNDFVLLNCHIAIPITKTDRSKVNAAANAYCPDCIVNLYIQDTKISVPPAVELGTAGPPALNRYIILKLLKLNVYWVIIIGAIEYKINGNVIFLNFWIEVAPSIVAASYKSSGIDCNTPVVTINIYGNPNQLWIKK
mgnify:CR=1 FL=1